MAKILLVEDDNNLREIYEARLQAEGYEIVAAADGEAALVVAKKEMPDLVISDVMMPRISGFEMLDIMRNTDGLKNVKVIMLTALGQAEDKTRADSLGADKYLVKSQVTLEDIVKAAAELLGEGTTSAPPMPSTPSTAAAAAELASTPVTPAPSMPLATPPPAVPVTPAPAMPVAPMPVAAPPDPAPAAAPVTPPMPVATPPAPAPDPAPPLPSPTPDLTAATPPASPPAPAAVTPPAPTPEPASPAATASNDGQLVADAVKDLISGTPGADSPASPPAPAPAAPPVPSAVPDLAPPPATTPPPAPAPDLASPAATPPAIPPAPAAVTPPEPVTPPAAGAPQNAVGDDEDTRTKKIIQPLGADQAPAPATPDLSELMAKEGHVLDTVQAQDNSLPHQPGHVISPNPVGAGGQPEDPNKISL